MRERGKKEQVQGGGGRPSKSGSYSSNAGVRIPSLFTLPCNKRCFTLYQPLLSTWLMCLTCWSMHHTHKYNTISILKLSYLPYAAMGSYLLIPIGYSR